MRLWRTEPDIGEPGRRLPLDPDDWKSRLLTESGAYDARGRWFTRDVQSLAWYARDVGDGLFRVVAVDVEEEDAARWLVACQPDAARFSRDPHNEHFLPRSVAETARRDEEMTAEVAALAFGGTRPR
jgi:hypothetical protein